MMNPLYLSMVQFQDELEAGSITPFDIAEKAKAFGLDGIELRREGWNAPENEAEELAAFCAERGLGITFAIYKDLFVRNDVEAQGLETDIRMAKRLEASFLRVFPGTIPPGNNVLWKTTKEILDFANSMNVMIAVENPGGILYTRRTIRRLLDILSHPALSTNFDIGNYAAAGEDLLDTVTELAPNIGGVHLKDIGNDGKDCALGDGTLPLMEILFALSEAAPDVIWTFEFSSSGEGPKRIEQSIEYIKKWREKL